MNDDAYKAMVERYLRIVRGLSDDQRAALEDAIEVCDAERGVAEWPRDAGSRAPAPARVAAE